jgi:hypothetical protein
MKNKNSDTPRGNGFMVISFVIAISLAMIGMLHSLAALASEKIGLEFELAERQRADLIALDCIYIAARTLVVQGSVRQLESRRIPVMDGICEITDLEERMEIVGNHIFFVARSYSGIFHSKIRAEIQAEGDAIKLIKI